MQAVLNHRGAFLCPQFAEVQPPATASAPEETRFALVVADLKKRGSARPRKLGTLRNTINAVFQNALSEEDISSQVALLQSHEYISVDATKVSYALPDAGGPL
jgi:hypothetical protein